MSDFSGMEPNNVAEAPGEKETGRLESFSDCVFSIALTLLVLDMKVPVLEGVPTAGAVWGALGRQWPSYFSFLTSFATVLIMWSNHHAIFRMIRRTNARLLFANGFLLLLVTVVPFPTALVSAYLKTPAAGAACVMYCVTFVIASLSYALLLHVARGPGNLLARNSEGAVRQRLRDCYFVGLPLYSLAAILASFLPWLSLVICSALWIFWCFTSVERRGIVQ